MSPPIVALHGFGGSPDDWIAVSGFDRADRVALAGHAGAPVPTTFEAEAKRIADHVRSRHGQAVHLVGYSLGGRLALAVAIEHPDGVARLTLVSSRSGITSPLERTERAARDEQWARLLEDRGMSAFIDAWNAQPLFATRMRVPPGTLARWRSRRMDQNPRALAAAMRVLGAGTTPDMTGSLESVRVPVVWIAGALDPRYCELASAAAMRSPLAEARILEGVGHDVLLEAPSAFAEIMGELDRVALQKGTS